MRCVFFVALALQYMNNATISPESIAIVINGPKSSTICDKGNQPVKFNISNKISVIYQAQIPLHRYSKRALFCEGIGKPFIFTPGKKAANNACRTKNPL